MGMDLHGRCPRSEEGRYFRANVWTWHILAEYVQKAVPEIASRCRQWHTNDGDGLGDGDSLALAERLDEEIKSGRCAEFVRAFEEGKRTAPDEPCEVCDGTGYRQPPPESGAGTQFCTACDGLGQRPAGVRSYRLSVEDVEAFAAFLTDCGGFTID